jgi:hypothetical protein
MLQPGDGASDALTRLPRNRIEIILIYSNCGKVCVVGQVEKVGNNNL